MLAYDFKMLYNNKADSGKQLITKLAKLSKKLKIMLAKKTKLLYNKQAEPLR